jgi:hypothetical protein
VFLDESEALTHPCLARCWARRGSELRIPAPGQAEKRAMLGACDPVHRHLFVHTSATRRCRTSHCSIIGTCLSPEDLNRLQRKAGLSLALDVEDFDVHGYFVTRSRNLSPLSKLVHKALDRQYAKEIARFRRTSSAEELWELWREGMRGGNVAGAYWALLIHKGAPRPMCIRAHNEVHMLSHLMGKASREDLKRVCQLEAVCAELSERLLKMRACSDALLRERENCIRALEIQLAAAAHEHQPEPRDRQAVKQSERLSRLQARFVTLERRLKVERARARAAEARLHEREEQGGDRRGRGQDPLFCDGPAAQRRLFRAGLSGGNR